MNEMRLNEFYCLSHHFIPAEVELVVRPKLSWEEESAIVLGRVPPPERFTLQRRKGKRWADDVFVDGGPRVVSERLVTLLDTCRFTGWLARDAVIRDGKSERRDYRVLLVTGRCGPILDEQNPIVEIPAISATGPYVRQRRIGFLLDPTAWDGSDLVRPDETGFVFVHERVRHALEAAGVSGVAFEKIMDVERDVF